MKSAATYQCAYWHKV